MDLRGNSLFGLVVVFTALTVTLQSHIEINTQDEQEDIIDITQRDMANVTQGNQESMEDAERIVGGRRRNIRYAPWQVYVQACHSSSCSLVSVCGGSIISTAWVLTAAHCFDTGKRGLIVTAGSTKVNPHETGNHVQVNRYSENEVRKYIFLHKKYRDTTRFNNDIALIKMKRPLRIQRRVKVIPLGTSKDVNIRKRYRIFGWGKRSKNNKYTEKYLRYVYGLKHYDWDDCKSIMGNLLTKNMMCQKTKGKNICKGDSGGALVSWSGRRYVQVGIASWFLTKYTCDRTGQSPSVFTDATMYKDWINGIKSRFG